MAFNSPEGDLEQIYLDDYALIDRFAAKGSLWLWGANGAGYLGDNTIVHRSSPVQTISGGTNWKSSSANNNHSAAIKTDGTLWLWGSGASGKLGDNTIVNKSSPVQTVAAGTNWKQVSAGGGHTAAIKTDGTLWLWGVNTYGNLGDNTVASKSSPVQTISAGTNWKQVVCGSSSTGAIKTDGTLWLWGVNGSGQLGDNTLVNKSSPVQTVAAGTNWKQVSAGGGHTAAIKTDGTLWLWGWNYYGQLGTGNLLDAYSPIQTISAGTNWKQVSVNSNVTAAIKTDGTLWLWGVNGSGQLGDNTLVDKSSPVQTISGGTNWKEVSTSGGHTAAIKTDGTLWSWGSGGSGRLGDNTIVSKSSPVQTISGGTNWKQVSAGGSWITAIKFDY